MCPSSSSTLCIAVHARPSGSVNFRGFSCPHLPSPCQQAGDSVCRNLGVRQAAGVSLCHRQSFPPPIPGCVHSFVCLPRTPFKKYSRGWRDNSVGKEFAVAVKTQVQILESPREARHSSVHPSLQSCREIEGWGQENTPAMRGWRMAVSLVTQPTCPLPPISLTL